MPPMSPVFALLAANVLLVVGTGLQSVLIPVRAHLDGFTDLMIGILGGGYYLGFVLGCLVVPRLVQRVGHIRAFAALAVVAAQTFPLHGALGQVPCWVALRLIAGFCLAGLSMIIESWVNEMSSNAERGRQLSIYLIVTAAASAAGQLCLRGCDAGAFLPFVVVCLAISLSVVPLVISVAPTPRLPSRVSLDIGKLYRTSPVGLIGCLFVGLANGAFWALAPLFTQRHGGSAGDAALFMGAAVLGGAASQWPIGRWSDRFDRRWLMVAACAGATFAALPLALLPTLSWPAEIALAAAFGASAFPLYALCVAHANDHAAAGRFVEISGGLLLTFGIGGAIGPLIAAPLPGGGGGLFLFTGAVHVALMAFVLLRMRARAPVCGRSSAAETCPAVGRLGGEAIRGCPGPSRADVPDGLASPSPRWAAR